MNIQKAPVKLVEEIKKELDDSRPDEFKDNLLVWIGQYYGTNDVQIRKVDETIQYRVYNEVYELNL